MLEWDEIKRWWLLLSETFTTIRFRKDFTDPFETNKGSPQGDSIPGAFFKIAFETPTKWTKQKQFSFWT